MYKTIIVFLTSCFFTRISAQDLPAYQKPILEKTDQAVFFQRGDTLALDFSKAFFGKLKVDVRALNINDRIVVRLGEKWKDGRLDMQPGGSIRAITDTFIKKGNEDVVYFPLKKDKRNTSGRAIILPSSFGTIIPFRAAEIISPKTVSVERIYYHYPFSDKAYIRTSNPLLDSILQLCMHTIKATTFAGLYVDGDRERIPYEADALINQLSHYVIDTSGYAIARHTIDYLMTHPSWPTEWHLQMHQLVWNDYIYTGNKELIKKYYSLLARKTLMAFETEEGIISTIAKPQDTAFLRSIFYTTFDGKEGLRDIVDWPQKGNIKDEPNYKGEADGFEFCSLNSVVNAYYYQSLKLMASFAKILGKKEDEVFYMGKAEKVRAAIKRYFFDEQTRLFVDGNTSKHSSLHANAFALAFGLVDHDDKETIIQFLKQKRMSCSVYGAQFLLSTLAQNGETAYVLDLITDRSSRSWYQMLVSGATMTAEAWDNRYKPNLDWNHAWGTAPLNVFVREIIGLKPDGHGRYNLEPKSNILDHLEVYLPIGKGWIYIKQIKQKLQIRIDGDVRVIYRGNKLVTGKLYKLAN